MPKYKGEESLKELDVPAYKRRGADPSSTQSRSEATTDADRGGPEEKKPPTRVSVRKLTASDIGEERPKVEKDDPNTPAFLRKMMD